MCRGWGSASRPCDLPRILENIALKRDDVSWGPNSTFRFPLQGGTGAIWRRRQALLPPATDAFRLLDRGHRYSKIGGSKLQTGETVEYDALISTMPLDRLLLMIDGPDELEGACAAGSCIHPATSSALA